MLTKDKMIDFYKTMWLIRQHESTVEDLKMKNKILGSMHLYLGQEAVATGVCSALEKDDYIMSTHRAHGHFLAKGASIDKMAGELCGRVTGNCRGKAGHMLVGDASVGALGGCGIVGAGVPIAVGYAMAFQTMGTKRVAVAFLGDGAMHEGSVHEAMNMASIHNYPVVFICENNLFGLSYPINNIKLTDLADKANAYGFPGVVVDGGDVLAVYEATKEAVERARKGDGPTFIEAKVFIQCAIGMGLRTDYFPDGYFEEAERKDPIKRFGGYLVERGILTQEQLKEIEEQTYDVARTAYDNALAAPRPDDSLLYENVYVD